VAVSDLNRPDNDDCFLSELRTASPASPLSLLPGRATIIAALLAASRLGLIRLPNRAAIGLVLTDLAHVIAILNHVRAAEAALIVSILCHMNNSLSLLRPASANKKHRDLLNAVPTRAGGHVYYLAIHIGISTVSDDDNCDRYSNG
jgi:hypothetical protein